MTHETVSLPTPDGACRCAVLRPQRLGSFPPVVFLHDGFGPRQSQFDMAARIAEWGYVVALPDLFYRVGSILDLVDPPAADVKSLAPRVLADQELRARFRERYFASATQPAHVEADLGAALSYLSEREDVRWGPVGVIGYCMGGNVALRAAAIFGDRVGAVACFHGGSIATDAPDSPHLGAPSIAARVLVVGATDDTSFSEDAKGKLSEAFAAAGLDHRIEQYAARHGFCVPDMPSYDEAAASRQYAALRALFDETLGAQP